MVRDANPIDVELPRFLAFCGNRPLVAHNAGFDMAFVGAACEKLGAKKLSHGDAGYEFTLIGNFKMRILVWAGDDEFPPNAQILYSDNFAEGFAAEDRVVAGDILITTIKANM